ncbi:FAD-binding oxidoreductase [Cellulomonas endophytica]|uniref:FAD-binding oxidoreductase n=1 Tax=Cellulomonas endophytica TaxID=2494735 RepID=UPI001F0CD736|nr:FAD-linked oxidase C-terminal domain-containing protein [Cellulomonas endophytica]
MTRAAGPTGHLAAVAVADAALGAVTLAGTVTDRGAAAAPVAPVADAAAAAPAGTDGGLAAPGRAPVPAAALAELADAVASVRTDATARDAARTDRSGWSAGGAPDAVVRATSVDDVVATLRWAHAHRVPVVPRGAGSGLAGGAAAGPGQVVLDVSGLDRVLAVRPEDGVAVVEPGVVTADLDRAARAHGLRYAPDPGSVELSTIGGNIATNAGGLRCVKYGVTRDAVLALDVVLADGSLLRTGAATLKGVTGYDLTSLFVGSEGTLGVVVRATLRLTPVPVATATVVASFAEVGDAAAAATAVTAAGVRPSTLELLDAATLAAVDAAQGTDLGARGGALLLVQTDGFAAAAEAEVVAGVLGATATHLERTADPERGAALVAARRLALPSIERHGTVLIEDVAVPRSALADAVRGIAAVSARTGVRVFTLAHAGDGNLHPVVLTDDGVVTPRVQRTLDAIVALALDLGGTLTGEHGVGALKRPWLDDELDPVARAAHRAVKAALDPLGLLNPGKAI